MSVALRPEAVADVRAARTAYEPAGIEVLNAFRDELDALLRRLEAFPRSGRRVDGRPRVRRAALRRFPFGVFYVVTDSDDVVVLRVMHTARSPARWP